jgi:adenosine kinase
MLNVSFLVPQLRREFGGCAGNIAYNLRLLGDAGYPMATVGRDFGPYAEWLQRAGVPTDHIKVLDSEHTAQGFVTTDLDDNQIWAFHPGAMGSSHLNRVQDAGAVTIGTSHRMAATEWCSTPRSSRPRKCSSCSTRGRACRCSTAELRTFIASNLGGGEHYEWQVLQQKTGWTAARVLEQVEAMIVTRGSEGSVIHTRKGESTFRAPRPRQWSIDHAATRIARASCTAAAGYDWEATGRIASLLGAIKSKRGTQNPGYARAVEQRYRQAGQNLGTDGSVHQAAAVFSLLRNRFEGHPDKVADQISDAILDAFLAGPVRARRRNALHHGPGRARRRSHFERRGRLPVRRSRDGRRIGYGNRMASVQGRSVLVAYGESRPTSLRADEAAPESRPGRRRPGPMFATRATRRGADAAPIFLAHRLVRRQAQLHNRAGSRGCVPMRNRR